MSMKDPSKVTAICQPVTPVPAIFFVGSESHRFLRESCKKFWAWNEEKLDVSIFLPLDFEEMGRI